MLADAYLQAELAEAGAALDAAHRLSDQLDRKEATIAALRDEGTATANSFVSLLRPRLHVK